MTRSVGDMFDQLRFFLATKNYFIYCVELLYVVLLIIPNNH